MVTAAVVVVAVLIDAHCTLLPRAFAENAVVLPSPKRVARLLNQLVVLPRLTRLHFALPTTTEQSVLQAAVAAQVTAVGVLVVVAGTGVTTLVVCCRRVVGRLAGRGNLRVV